MNLTAISTSKSTNFTNAIVATEKILYLDYYTIRKSLWSSTFYLNRYGSLLWMVLGLILNPLALLTWMRPKLRRHNTSSNYLAGIAVADFLFWIFYFLNYLKMWWNISAQNAPIWCELFPGLFIAIQYFSVPLVLVFSIERYIAVCHPFQRDKICTHKRALINTIVCGVTVTILGFLQMMSQQYSYENETCQVRESVLLNIYYQIFQTSVEMLISAILPFATLIVNILVIVELKRITNKSALMKPTLAAPVVTVNSSENSIEANRHSLLMSDEENKDRTPINNSSQNKEKNAFKSSTILLLSVSFLLIVTTLPVGLVYALQYICPNGNESLSLAQMQEDPQWIRFANYQIVKELVDFFAQIHFVINFVVYYITGDNFREEFHRMISCNKRNKTKNQFSHYDDASTGTTNIPGSNSNSTHRGRVNRTEMIRKPLLTQRLTPVNSINSNSNRRNNNAEKTTSLLT